MVDTRASSTPRQARIATSSLFTVHGVVMASFAARLPWVSDHVGVGVGGLGVALLMPGIGAMLAMPLSARLTHRYDLRSLTRVLLLPGWPTNLPVLYAALLVYGACAGLADVAMNAHAVRECRRDTQIETERRTLGQDLIFAVRARPLALSCRW